MNALQCNLSDEDKAKVLTALQGLEKMLISTREGLTRKGSDASLSNYVVYQRAFKLMGAVELADAMGVEVGQFAWIWKLKPVLLEHYEARR